MCCPCPISPVVCSNGEEANYSLSPLPSLSSSSSTVHFICYLTLSDPTFHFSVWNLSLHFPSISHIFSDYFLTRQTSTLTRSHLQTPPEFSAHKHISSFCESTQIFNFLQIKLKSVYFLFLGSLVRPVIMVLFWFQEVWICMPSVILATWEVFRSSHQSNFLDSA